MRPTASSGRDPRRRRQSRAAGRRRGRCSPQSFWSSAWPPRHVIGPRPASPDDQDPSAGPGQPGPGRATASPRLAAATSAPAPAPPSLAASAPLQSHEVFGYAPYWTLPQSPIRRQGHDHAGLLQRGRQRRRASTRAAPGGTATRARTWSTWSTRAHAAGDRVVLTITCFNQATLNQITSDPNAPARLSAAAHRRRAGQEPRRRQLRLRGRGQRRPGRPHQPDHQGVGGAARHRSPLAGDHGHLRQRGRRPERVLRHRRPGPRRRRLLRDGLRHELRDQRPAPRHRCSARPSPTPGPSSSSPKVVPPPR